MEEKNNKLDKVKIHNYINIKEFSPLKKRLFSFRYYHRSYKVLLTIDKNNLKKLECKKDDNQQVDYSTNNREHTCMKNKNLFAESSNNKITNNDEIELATNIIKNQLDKTLIWHIQNLENNIHLTKTKIENILQNLRQLKYEDDTPFLLDITYIKIDFSKTDKDLIGLPF